MSALAAPSVTTLSPAAEVTVSALSQISVTFSEPVTGVDADDLLINNEPSAGVSGSGAGPYVFSFTQPAPGLVSVSWDFDHNITGIGTGVFVQNAWTYTLTDAVPPTIGKIRSSTAGQELDAITPLPGTTVAVLTQVEVFFSEPVTGVDSADLLINSSPATAVSGSGAGPYIFSFTQPSAGTVTFEWAANAGIKDLALPPNNFAGGTWNTTLDAAGPGTVIINEFLAANATSVLDEDQSQPGWIELYNSGTSPVNLAGWALTNDTAEPSMWVIPNRTIQPGGFLVVFASGKDRKPTTGNLHANFQLNANGGFLALMGPGFPRTATSSFNPYPPQRYDYSYGLIASGENRYFSRPLPTPDPRPGTANGSSNLTGLTERPSVSVSRGFFKETFPVVLSCPDATAVIRYTLDGSDVTAASPIYNTPLNITATTVLRAAAFGANSVPSASVTHSYIFLDKVLSQPSPPYDNPANATDNTNPPLPKVGNATFPVAWGTSGTGAFPGLVTNLTSGQIPADYGMDPEILNDPAKYDDNGIVNSTTGKTNLDRVKQGLRELPILSIVMRNDDMFGSAGLYPNSTQKGVTYEKPCSVEMLLPDGTTAFATTCGIRIHGNASRNPQNTPKHGFKLNFKGDFGASSLDYRLFTDSPVEEFDDIILRADYNSSWLHWDGSSSTGAAGGQRARGTRLRDAWCKDTFRAMGWPAGHHRYVNLFINGVYWGTYDPTEQQNNGFAAAYFGGSKNDYDVVEQGALKSGTLTAYNAMLAIAAPIDNPKYEQMKGYLDVPEFADYMLFHFFTGHQDWGDDINKNWYAVRYKFGGKFKYIPWDQENLMWDPGVDRTTVASPASGLHPKLVTNAQYRLDFADRVHKHMVAPDGQLLPAANISRWNKWRSLLTNAIVGEAARWGDYRRDVHQYSSGPYPLYNWTTHWVPENNRLTSAYFPARTNNVLNQLRARTLYPTLNAPVVQNDATSTALGSQQIAAGTQIKMVFPSSPPSGTLNTGTIYYTTDGSDPRVYYTGTVAASAQTYSTPITITTTTTVKARSLNGTTWSALNELQLTVGFNPQPVKITEIMYNPGAGGSAAEYIEIQNTSTETVNMSGWYMEGVEFVFPSGFALGAGSRAVLASNNAPATFAATYPGVVVAGYFGGNLNNAGERIALLDDRGRVVFAVAYGDGGVWPSLADGGGYSIELANLGADPNDYSAWKQSAQLKGSPGTANPGFVNSGVEISEVLAENATITVNGQVSDFVELHNTTAGLVDISGWSIFGSVLQSIPAGTTIPAGGYLAVAVNSLNGGPAGGQIILRNAASAAVDSISWGNQLTDRSIGKVAGSWILNIPTPGAANAAAVTAAPGGNLFLNEWLPDSAPGQSDWVELFNNHATLPVALRGLYLQTSTQLFQIRSLSFLAPKSWLQLFADETSGANHLGFTLPAEGTSLALLDNGGVAVDNVTITSQPEGVSEGRQTDGAATLVSFGNNPTPGRANALIANYTGPTFNELLVVNTTGALAPWGSRAPWVELVNPSASPVDFSGKGVGPSQDPSTQVYRFPAGTSIAAGGTLVLWLGKPAAGETVPPGTLYVTQWSPVSTGGACYLFDTESSGSGILDLISFGNQVPNSSIGKTAAGWKLLATATPGSANSAEAALAPLTSVRINEWCAITGNSGALNPFIELYNTAAQPVELSGSALTDDPSESNLAKSLFGQLSFIAPNGWLKLDALNARLPGAANFNLAAAGEYLRLSGPDLAQIDAISFGLQTYGMAEGRFEDGSTTVNLRLLPTPGARNALLPPPSVLAQPVDQTVNAGGSANFQVSAGSTTLVTYSWRFNGQPLAGKTDSLLNLQGVTAGQDGLYTCAVTNPAGTTVSTPGKLIVLADYNTWLAGNNVPGGSTGITADPDFDGLDNLEEYFHNLGPTKVAGVNDRAALPQVGFEPGNPAYLTLTYRRSIRATLSSVKLKISSALGTWDDVTPDVTQNLGPDPITGDDIIRQKVIIPPGTPQKFLRLELTP
jgi:hypothetical protein